MSVRLFRGEEAIAAIDPANRGLHYGDGLFETMRADAGTIPWFDRHWARLALGAGRLAIALPAREAVGHAFAELLCDMPAEGAVAKLLLTRGEGGRGYAALSAATPVWQICLHPLPPARGDLHLVRCATRLAIQPALAGLKHCNRLEQVLARAEVDAAGADEGLQFDTDGEVASAVAGNVLLHIDGAWWTPPVERRGVAGVMRGWLLEQGLLQERSLNANDLEAAQAIAVCNAVRGILAVRRLDARAWAPSAAIEALRSRLAQAHPGFARERQ